MLGWWCGGDAQRWLGHASQLFVWPTRRVVCCEEYRCVSGVWGNRMAQRESGDKGRERRKRCVLSLLLLFRMHEKEPSVSQCLSLV